MKKMMSFWIDDNLHDLLLQTSEQLEIPMSALIRGVLKEWMKKSLKDKKSLMLNLMTY